MIKNNTWSTFVEGITSSKFPISQFRMDPVYRDIPLFGVNIYPEYVNFAYEIYSSKEVNQFDWRFAMQHDKTGYMNCSWYYNADNYKINTLNTCHTMLKCNHHFYKYNFLTGKNILDYKHIVELGGGVGDFAKFVINLGYKGSYTIIDLPELFKVQKFNLNGYDVNYTSKPVINNFDSEDVLFISTWALSECPLGWRKEVLDALKPKNWLITYQRNFEGVNNEVYFKNWAGKRLDIPYLRWDGGSEYILK